MAKCFSCEKRQGSATTIAVWHWVEILALDFILEVMSKALRRVALSILAVLGLNLVITFCNKGLHLADAENFTLWKLISR